MLLMNQLIVQY